MSPSPLFLFFVFSFFLFCLQDQPTHSLDRKSHQNSKPPRPLLSFFYFTKTSHLFQSRSIDFVCPQSLSRALVTLHVLHGLTDFSWKWEKKRAERKKDLSKSSKVLKHGLLNCNVTIYFMLFCKIHYMTKGDKFFQMHFCTHCLNLP